MSGGGRALRGCSLMTGSCHEWGTWLRVLGMAYVAAGALYLTHPQERVWMGHPEWVCGWGYGWATRHPLPHPDGFMGGPPPFIYLTRYSYSFFKAVGTLAGSISCSNSLNDFLQRWYPCTRTLSVVFV